MNARNRSIAFFLGIWERIRDEVILGLQLITVIPVVILFIKEKASGLAWFFYLFVLGGMIFFIYDLRSQEYYWIIGLVLYLIFSSLIVTGELRALKYYEENPDKKPPSIW